MRCFLLVGCPPKVPVLVCEGPVKRAPQVMCGIWQGVATIWVRKAVRNLPKRMAKGFSQPR